MYEKLDELILMTEACTKSLWSCKIEGFRNEFPGVIDRLIGVLPQIIMSYSDPKMADISSDAMYWPEQMEKIVSLANDGGDIIALSDALYHELRANLIDYKNTLMQREVSV